MDSSDWDDRLNQPVPHAEPWNQADVAVDQPWLTPAERESCEAALHRTDAPPPWLMHYILTEDFRLVEEPNVLRWAIFLERAKHRFIDRSRLRGGVSVSTVFVGTCGTELFETIIFGGMLHGVRYKTDTLGRAKLQHWDVVQIASQCGNYLARRRRGKLAAKWRRRMDRTISLARKRGEGWAQKHSDKIESLYSRVALIPGRPAFPHPNWIVELAALFVARPSTRGSRVSS